MVLQELRLHTARGTDLERLTSVMRCLTGITSLALGRSQARFLVPSNRRPNPCSLYEQFPFRFCCCIFCECDGRTHGRGSCIVPRYCQVRPSDGMQSDRRSRLRLEVLAPLAALRTLHLQVPHDGSFKSLATATGLTSLTTAHPVNHGQEASCRSNSSPSSHRSIKFSVEPEAWI